MLKILTLKFDLDLHFKVNLKKIFPRMISATSRQLPVTNTLTDYATEYARKVTIAMLNNFFIFGFRAKNSIDRV
jgi:hypothetical protein